MISVFDNLRLAERVARSTALERVVFAVLSALTLALVVVAVLSLRWRTVHDLPIMMYCGFLMDRFGYVPYRDFFDFNMPGTHLLSFLLGRVIGYGDLGMRIVDLAYLAAILMFTVGYMRRFGRASAWAGAALFGTFYFSYGPHLSLQREYLLILPLAGAMWLAFADRPSRRWWSAPVLIGLAFGFAATVKLHSAIGLPLVVWYVIRSRSESAPARSRDVVRVVAVAAGAFVLPLAAMLGYLWATGALKSFLRMASGYWPLYASLSNNHETISGAARWYYLIERYGTLGGMGLWVMPAVVGLYIALFSSPIGRIHRLRLVLLGGMGVAYSLYPVITGQFWPYHWLPFQYFMLQCGALCLVSLPNALPRIQRLFPATALLVVLTLKVGGPHVWLAQKQFPSEAPKGGKVDQIAGFLSVYLRPGDTVQPIDWTGGAVHAMLIARARLATRFVYAHCFYHHISSPYIKGLRREFITELKRARPRFVIRMLGDFPLVHGLDTTDHFVDLDTLLEREYTVAWEGDGFLIYERIT